jgi:coiled-coil domain-containing protein 61
MTEIKQEGCYHGQEYLINVKIGADSLQIELESKYDAYWWNGSFTAGYLEELTAKTGEQLQFAKFGELIANSLQRPDQGCNFKVLTF